MNERKNIMLSFKWNVSNAKYKNGCYGTDFYANLYCVKICLSITKEFTNFLPFSLSYLAWEKNSWSSTFLYKNEVCSSLNTDQFYGTQETGVRRMKYLNQRNRGGECMREKPGVTNHRCRRCSWLPGHQFPVNKCRWDPSLCSSWQLCLQGINEKKSNAI